jgi:hypothetical protein
MYEYEMLVLHYHWVHYKATHEFIILYVIKFKGRLTRLHYSC